VREGLIHDAFASAVSKPDTQGSVLLSSGYRVPLFGARACLGVKWRNSK